MFRVCLQAQPIAGGVIFFEDPPSLFETLSDEEIDTRKLALKGTVNYLKMVSLPLKPTQNQSLLAHQHGISWLGQNSYSVHPIGVRSVAVPKHQAAPVRKHAQFDIVSDGGRGLLKSSRGTT